MDSQQELARFNKEEYLEQVHSILKPAPVIDIGALIFGSGVITVPFFLIYTGIISRKIQEKSVDTISSKSIKHICTDKYGRDRYGNILNSDGVPKNPQTADDLPDHDITVNDIVPSIIDQHGTYGVPV